MNMRERVARAIAAGMGDSYDHAFESKTEWNQARGEKGGRFRYINEPFTTDYEDAADAVLDELMTPTEGMIYSGHDPLEASVGTSNGELYFDAEGPHHTFIAMIKAAKEGK